MTTAMTCTRLTIFTVAGIFLQIIGLSIFVFGFFPVKPTLSGVSGSESYRDPFCDSSPISNESELHHPDKLKLLYQELSGISSKYDRLILMVIDGLPAEFVLGKDGKPPWKVWKESMPYTQSLLANGDAIGYHAKAAPPTVTMPRLKAMVSGAIGGFLDVAFNFNTQALLDDNLLGQFFRIGWKMVMLGDETWLKLFPGLFMRHDGVSSFFVKDTVQVDRNISRHLPDELNSDDWNLLILHYLGLDHVGHTGGRNSPLMPAKLKEMDDIVRTMHLRAMMDRSHDQGQTLLIIVSDHGMTENGNHGGSSYEETDSLMLFIGLNSNISDYASATNNVAFQVDLAPTLALLFGVPIPKNNVGVLVPGTLSSLRDFEQLRALELNSWQLLRLMQAQIQSSSFPGFSCNCFLDGTCEGIDLDISECSGDKEKQLICLFRNAAVLHGIWKSKKSTESSSAMEDFSRALDAYNTFLKTASEWLASKTTEKPVLLLGLGVSAMLISCFICATVFLSLFKEVYHEPKDQVCSLSYLLNLEEMFIFALLLILVISMGSSSMVEEEHYIWHFMVSTFYLLLLFKIAKSFNFSEGMNILRDFKFGSIFSLLISGRLLRGWHQGGVNWTYLPDISKWLQQVGSGNVKWIQLISNFLVIVLGLYTLFRTGLNRKSVRILAFGFSACGFLILLHAGRYQDEMSTEFGATVTVKVIYYLLSISAIGASLVLPWSALNKDKSFLAEVGDCLYSIGSAYILCWCLLQLLLQQPINSGPILLLLLQILAILCLSSNDLQVNEWVEIAALYYMGMAGHFALGNSNTLATIDVAGAFIGISSHSTILSGILMFMITYASPMLFLLSLVMYIGAKLRNHSHSTISTHPETSLGQILKLKLGFPCLVPLCINSVLLTAYTVVLLLMRNHLFVWSVFSPKYLYVCATTLCTYIGVCIVAATVTYTFSVTTFHRSNRTRHNNS
ncbi:Type I phosphodiesterase/nucleotide pyrophosphatase/phosphate transferase [Arabidopsis suecica]|uniref:Type I phosphodiesterase/nucleotide pyrophosphatase/phosphate transferase n=1 Tax=Arabidopsis suecica TaxID=45249 RepID=A0A8T2AG68_ARASU|nr:Type I phosphodiesterase/nucleotide pyrophosphatase/phosphate transferase [Arabidopsis suecica]